MVYISNLLRYENEFSTLKKVDQYLGWFSIVSLFLYNIFFFARMFLSTVPHEEDKLLCR